MQVNLAYDFCLKEFKAEINGKSSNSCNFAKKNTSISPVFLLFSIGQLDNCTKKTFCPLLTSPPPFYDRHLWSNVRFEVQSASQNFQEVKLNPEYKLSNFPKSETFDSELVTSKALQT